MPYASISRHIMRLLVIVGFGLIGAVLAEAGAPAQEDPPEQPPQSCAQCHLDVVTAWEDSTHAQAYTDTIFQEYWQAQDSNPACLACHTTGFEARTGEYKHEGVTCEACHGQTPTNHPPEPVAIDPGVETCEDCHTTTFTEWEQSAHGEQQLACTVCHEPHPQQLRFGEANALCLNCHDEDARDDYAHLVHADQECVSCHWFRAEEEDLLAHYESGNLFPTGHTSFVETQSCVACHEGISNAAIVDEGKEALNELGMSSSMHPLLQAQVRLAELEAEVDTVKAQGENTSALRLAQGLIIGLAMGGLVVFGVTRFRRRADHVVAEHKEE